jgi:hypothetical protein
MSGEGKGGDNAEQYRCRSKLGRTLKLKIDCRFESGQNYGDS